MEERPHDILAAEGFTVPAADPALRREPPHDVLAAEGFSVGTGDPGLRQRPLTVPDAPFDAGEPVHDVLAAEEFAVPAGRPGAAVPDAAAGHGRQRIALAGTLAAGVALVLRRRR